MYSCRLGYAFTPCIAIRFQLLLVACALALNSVSAIIVLKIAAVNKMAVTILIICFLIFSPFVIKKHLTVRLIRCSQSQKVND
jgi:hypothetical protein